MKGVLTFLITIALAGLVVAQGDLVPIGISGLDENSRFGHGVALNDGTALISAPYQEVNGEQEQGAVYVFTNESGSILPVGTLLAPDGRQFDRFGYSVSLQGNVAAIGAPGKKSGQVYIYERENGQWLYKESIRPLLEEGQYVNAMQFGFKVLLHGNYVFVTAPHYLTAPAIQESSIYVYSRQSSGSWEFLQRLTDPQGQSGTLFGYALAADGQRLIVGAAKADGGASASGCAYLFELDNGLWNFSQQFIYPGSVSFERFGASVDIHEDRVIIGSLMHVFDNNEGPKGTAHVYAFTGNVWIHTGMLTSAFTERNDFFAQHVAIEGDVIVVSATRATHSGVTDAGSVHVYRLENGFWTEKYRLIPKAEDVQPHMYFGGSFALSGKYLLIGSHLADNANNDSGNSYLHNLSDLVDTHESHTIQYAIKNISPNPFRDAISLQFDLPVRTMLRIEAFDSFGRVVEVLADGMFDEGSDHTIVWQPRDLPSGTYYIQLRAGKNIATAKIIHVR